MLLLPTQLDCTHFYNTYSKQNMTVCTRDTEERTALLYLGLISDSGYTNIINQVD